jgi:hypothetical protein
MVLSGQYDFVLREKEQEDMRLTIRGKTGG